MLDRKKWAKNDRIFKFFELNEIHIVDSEHHKDIIFSREVLISGEARPENLGKMSNNRDI